MRLNLFHIVLSVLLSFAVTNYLWIEFLDDEQIVAELESEKEQESEKEVREDLSSEEENFLDGTLSFDFPRSFNFHQIASGFVKHGNSFDPVTQCNHPKLFILHHQLRLPC